MPILYPASNRFKYARSANGFRERRRAIQTPPEDLFSPSLLFSAMEQGAWPAPSDLSTIYQDAAGTTPVTAVEQPVGLMLDKSKGLVLGPELVVNGDFSSGTTGWALFAGVSVSDGRLAFNTTSNEGASQPAVASAGVVGRVYQIEFDLISYTRGSPQILFGDATFNYISTSLGRKRLALTLKSGGIFQIIAGNFGAGGECVIDNISVRELPGNHASQSTATSRPVLSARVNQLLKTEQFPRW